MKNNIKQTFCLKIIQKNNLRSRKFCSFNNKIDVLHISKNLLEVSAKDINKAILNLKDLCKLDKEFILQQLSDDNKKKTFWINIYNTLIRVTLQDSQLESLYPKFEFFEKPIFKIAGMNLSFDDIEHRILRRSIIKFSLGYLSNPFAKKWEKEFRVDELDCRIHFALNCGAKSCPRIQTYDENLIDEQLEKATKNFLSNDSVYDNEKNTLELSKIFYWFHADFGGKQGILKMHRDHGIIPMNKKNVRINYKEYNWNRESNLLK